MSGCLRLLGPALLCCALAGRAEANGRMPAAVGIVNDQAQPDRVLVPVTFGLLVSDDAGAAFSWICEQAIGVTGERWDPQVVQLPGRILVSTEMMGVTASTDGGCTFASVGGPLATQHVSRLTLASDGRTVLVATAKLGSKNGVFTSTDGVTFTESSMASDARVFDSVEGASGDPNRVYATSLSLAFDDAMLHVSSDGGRTSIARRYPTTATQVQILGTDKANADIVYLRVRQPDTVKILKTTDAGLTFTEVLAGRIIVAAYEPQAGTLYASISGADGGFQRSTDGGVTWLRGATDPRPLCLGFDRQRNVIGCTLNFGPELRTMLARSTDQGATFNPYLELVPRAFAGPVSCPAGTPTHDLCEPLWPGLARQLGLVGAGGADGGAGGADAGASADAGPRADGGATPGAGGGCGCTVGGGRTERQPWLLPLLLGALALAWRRAR
jgi:hypothetical protein